VRVLTNDCSTQVHLSLLAAKESSTFDKSATEGSFTSRNSSFSSRLTSSTPRQQRSDSLRSGISARVVASPRVSMTPRSASITPRSTSMTPRSLSLARQGSGSSSNNSSPNRKLRSAVGVPEVPVIQKSSTTMGKPPSRLSFGKAQNRVANLPSTDLDYAYSSFSQADVSRNRYLSIVEFERAFRIYSANKMIPKETADATMTAVRRKGVVKFKFSQYVAAITGAEDAEILDPIKAGFDLFDKNAMYAVRIDEFKNSLKENGCSESDLNEIMNIVGKSRIGVVTFSEYYRVVTTTGFGTSRVAIDSHSANMPTAQDDEDDEEGVGKFRIPAAGEGFETTRSGGSDSGYARPRIPSDPDARLHNDDDNDDDDNDDEDDDDDDGGVVQAKTSSSVPSSIPVLNFGGGGGGGGTDESSRTSLSPRSIDLNLAYHTFTCFDRDCDHELRPSEMVELLKNLNKDKKLSQKLVDLQISTLLHSNESIPFEEFIDTLTERNSTGLGEMKRNYETFPLTEKGILVADFMFMLQSLEVTEVEKQKAVEMIDMEKAGYVTFEEFHNVSRLLGPSKVKLYPQDIDLNVAYRIFTRYDRDKDQELSFSELSISLKELCKDKLLSQKLVETQLSASQNSNRSTSFEKFIDMTTKIDSTNLGEMKKNYETFPLTQQGIPIVDFMDMFLSLDVTEAESRKAKEMVNREQSGFVSFEEFHNVSRLLGPSKIKMYPRGIGLNVAYKSFSRYDRDADQELRSSEMFELLKELAKDNLLSQKIVATQLSALLNSSHPTTFEQFIDISTTFDSTGLGEMKRNYETFPLTEQGIAVKDFMSMFRSIEVTDEELIQAKAMVNLDNSGFVSFEEFHNVARLLGPPKVKMYPRGIGLNPAYTLFCQYDGDKDNKLRSSEMFELLKELAKNNQLSQKFVTTQLSALLSSDNSTSFEGFVDIVTSFDSTGLDEMKQNYDSFPVQTQGIPVSAFLEMLATLDLSVENEHKATTLANMEQSGYVSFEAYHNIARFLGASTSSRMKFSGSNSAAAIAALDLALIASALQHRNEASSSSVVQIEMQDMKHADQSQIGLSQELVEWEMETPTASKGIQYNRNPNDDESDKQQTAAAAAAKAVSGSDEEEVEIGVPLKEPTKSEERGKKRSKLFGLWCCCPCLCLTWCCWCFIIAGIAAAILWHLGYIFSHHHSQSEVSPFVGFGGVCASPSPFPTNTFIYAPQNRVYYIAGKFFFFDFIHISTVLI
jgi:Ca2+-binding EF-hand superfamily protein